jgi:D-sedoheptulose 7-phosphate isomerase
LESIKNYYSDRIKVLYELLNNKKQLNNITNAAEILISCLKSKKKILLCGNGGSAADSQHIAAELVSKFNLNRSPLSAIALTTDSSILTSIGNDFNFKFIFSKQIEAIGSKGDVLLAYTTSGNSLNILEAIKSAKKKKIFTIVLTGKNKGKVINVCDLAVEVPSSLTPNIQECHLSIGHFFCQVIENFFFRNK